MSKKIKKDKAETKIINNEEVYAPIDPNASITWKWCDYNGIPIPGANFGIARAFVKDINGKERPL